MLPVRAYARLLKTSILGSAVLAILAMTSSALSAQTLQGSRASMDRQVRAAQQHDFTFIDTPERVRFFADQGWLVRIESTRDFVVKNDVRYPYARPEVKLFAERLGRQYRRACGEQLVVTSLTRPTTRQPRNASDRSVHPTGMALDLRYSWNRACREWLQGVLASLERQGVLEATLERNPRHYHVALFPRPYANYVASLAARGVGGTELLEYRVRRGDSLWTIARAHGTTVGELRDMNGIRGSRIYVGQVIDVPQGG
jgi:hypothetical protein